MEDGNNEPVVACKLEEKGCVLSHVKAFEVWRPCSARFGKHWCRQSVGLWRSKSGSPFLQYEIIELQLLPEEDTVFPIFWPPVSSSLPVFWSSPHQEKERPKRLKGERNWSHVLLWEKVKLHLYSMIATNLHSLLTNNNPSNAKLKLTNLNGLCNQSVLFLICLLKRVVWMQPERDTVWEIWDFF